MRTGSAEMFASRRMASTRGLDETRQALSEAFLPVAFPAARSDDDVRMHLNALLVGRITCGFMRFRGAVRIETVEAQDYHVDIPMDGRSVMRAGAGAPVHASSTTAGAFVPGEPVELDCSDDFAQLSVMIPRDLMQLEVEALLGRDDLAPVHFASEIDLSTPASRLVLQALQLIDGASDQASGPLAHPLALQRLEQVLLHSLLFGQPHNYSSELTGPAPKGGPRPLSQAVELLRRRPEHPWTVTELAAAVSTSARSLQEAFRRTLDTTPMAYLRRQRLERVREELLVAAPEAVSVTEVATRWGFIHLSRFAASYRAAFSENPSDTLRS
ncbi:xylulose kinase [Rathayibacter sp. Leaf299]|uniref:AraC-like ligand-binding domain-containing protein n=1 Tax=Rathayibacter sp. Leaf299 TaxID=1736328 RepID=UPI0006FEF77E|nr:helix-turn-helix domain-containing protein [Rathayibacter sp. Leaf299]KQQ21723.1 xylulose kinase [Rathayibacter sp. Leaf299]